MSYLPEHFACLQFLLYFITYIKNGSNYVNKLK
jgi:hypothetical protein